MFVSINVLVPESEPPHTLCIDLESITEIDIQHDTQKSTIRARRETSIGMGGEHRIIRVTAAEARRVLHLLNKQEAHSEPAPLRLFRVQHRHGGAYLVELRYLEAIHPVHALAQGTNPPALMCYYLLFKGQRQTLEVAPAEAKRVVEAAQAEGYIEISGGVDIPD